MRTRRIFRKLTGRWRPDETSELGTLAIHRAALRALAKAAPPELDGDHLDIGSGTGELLRAVQAHFPMQSFACDYTNRFMETPGQKVDIVDLNREALPYADNRFSLVTCLETVEHLENYRALIRDVYRVLQPGGVAIFSTPNVLNLRSRFRYFSSGFYNLFGPLALDRSNMHGARGHITPVNWFYFAHALVGAGFRNIEVTVDKYQRRSLPAYFLLLAPMRLANAIVYRRDQRKYMTVTEANAWMVRLMNSRDLLLGRSLIVSAAKP
jgi:SAM-dependent methyltransferase